MGITFCKRLGTLATHTIVSGCLPFRAWSSGFQPSTLYANHPPVLGSGGCLAFRVEGFGLRVETPNTKCQTPQRLGVFRVGGVPREQKMFKGHLPRVMIIKNSSMRRCSRVTYPETYVTEYTLAYEDKHRLGKTWGCLGGLQRESGLVEREMLDPNP